MRKEDVLKQLREKGCRITKQREVLIDIILDTDCSNCKEIYYRALKRDPGIGMATVYRMVHKLDEIGAIKQEAAYFIRDEQYIEAKKCIVRFADEQELELDEKELMILIEKGLKSDGCTKSVNIKQLLMKGEEN